MTPLDRFLAQVKFREDGCWEWTGARHVKGYGQIKVNNRAVRAHRFSYETFVAPIPDGLTIDHLCRHTWCVNPDHLRPLDHLANSSDNAQSRRTHCPSGHPYDAVNTLIGRRTGSGAPFRRCRTCASAQQRAWRDRNKAKSDTR